MFALLDVHGHPVGCGFFVSPDGFALTINHDLALWSREDAARGDGLYVSACKLGGSGEEIAYTFRLAHADEELDFCVLELIPAEGASAAAPGPAMATPFFPLPRARIADDALWGKPATVVHGSIALNRQFQQHPEASIGHCNIATVHPERLLYTALTTAGDSGGALLLCGRELVGLHVEGVNDVIASPKSGTKRHKTVSEATSPSTACALRLDIAAVRDAVAAAQARQRERGRQ